MATTGVEVEEWEAVVEWDVGESEGRSRNWDNGGGWVL